MPNVYIREERVVYNESLAEGLPSGVHGVHTENEMGRLELPVSMNKNLGLEYKVQVLYVNCSNILGKYRTVSSKR